MQGRGADLQNIPGMKFHLDTNTILGSATRLALRLKASAVEIDHLLLCDPQNVEEPVESRDIPFSSGIRDLLQAAAELVHREESSIIRPRHLQLVLYTHTGLCPDWGLQRQRVHMVDLIDRALASTLDYKGVDVEKLRVGLHGLTVRECRPRPEFKSTPAGRRFSEISARLATKKDAVLTLLLLSYLLCEGPAAGPFLQAGLNEELLVGLLEEHPDELRRPPNFKFDFSQLGIEADRFSFDASHAIELAWLLREGPVMCGHDLLRGLVVSSDPMEEFNVHRLLTRLTGYDFLETFVRDKRFAGAQSEVELDPEVHRILDTAVREAALGGPINSVHLLIGLAQNGNEMLARKGVTAEKIRKHLG